MANMHKQAFSYIEGAIISLMLPFGKAILQNLGKL